MSEEVELEPYRKGFSSVGLEEGVDVLQTAESTDDDGGISAPKTPVENSIDKSYFAQFIKKLIGPCNKRPDRNDLMEIMYASVLGFIGVLLVAVTGYWFLGRDFTLKNGTSMIFVTGAYAATAVLVYDIKLLHAPVAQPRNVIGGFGIGTFMAVATRIVCLYIGLEQWTTGAFAFMFAMIAMSLTNTIHPPAGAAALIGVIGGPGIWDLGFGYVLTSIGGAVIMVMVALIGNNLIPSRQYPSYWF